MDRRKKIKSKLLTTGQDIIDVFEDFMVPEIKERMDTSIRICRQVRGEVFRVLKDKRGHVWTIPEIAGELMRIDGLKNRIEALERGGVLPAKSNKYCPHCGNKLKEEK